MACVRSMPRQARSSRSASISPRPGAAVGWGFAVVAMGTTFRAGCDGSNAIGAGGDSYDEAIAVVLLHTQSDFPRSGMPLEGLHHITAITGDAPRNVDFYARLLGLRLVKKTVNFDAPDVYHLYYGDERGTPGSILTFFEFPGAISGRHGDGMVYTIQWRVGSEEALGFWAARLTEAGVAAERGD